MPRTFAYCRVSTDGQTTNNQVMELASAGFAIDPRRIVRETVSGSQAAKERPQFSKLLDRLESGDVLLVTKLDRLGRSAVDVRKTVDSLAALGVKVHCLALGGMDLTSAAGRMTMQVISAMAEFELDLLKERTATGMARAVKDGARLGRPSKFTPEEADQVRQRLAAGEPVAALARELKVGRATVQRLRPQ